MEVSMVRQSLILLYSLIIGCGLGMVYDIIRIHRVMLGVEYAHRTVRMLKTIRLPLIDARKRPPSPLRRKIRAGMRLCSDVIIFLQYIMFFVFAGVVVTVFIYHANYGQIRWFALFGLMVGFFVYYNTLGRIVMLCSEFIAFFIRAMLSYVWYFIYVPAIYSARMIRRFFSWIFTLICCGVRSILHRLSSLYWSKRLRQETLSGAIEGFLGD